MMRTLPNGKQRFCYGLFTAALVVSAVAGSLIAYSLDASLSDHMAVWFAAAVGGNLGTLVVDIARRITHF